MKLTDEEKELIMAKRREGKIKLRTLDSYSVEDKCQFFDKIYRMAMNNLQQREMHQQTYKYNAIEFDLYDEAMCLLTPKGEENIVFWRYYNTLPIV